MSEKTKWPHFSLRSLMLWMAFVSITFAGWSAMARWVRPIDYEDLNLPITVIFYGPFWLPLVFVAFMLGRGKPTIGALVTFAVWESLLIAYVVSSK